MYLCSCTVRRIEFSVSQFSDINHIIHESAIGLTLAGLKALVFVVARVRNSEARKEITLNTFTLYREK